MSITTERNEYTALHLKPHVKEALRKEAKKRSAEKQRRVSMSELISFAVEEKLRECGYNV